MAEEAVSAALSATLSNDSSSRAAAEHALARLANHPHHAHTLLRLATARDQVVAAAAALRLKNLVRAAKSAPNDTTLSHARGLVRPHVLDALASVADSNVSGMLAETVRWIILADFPARWPQLLTQIHSFLVSGSDNKVYAALVTLRKLTKCYEFKSNDPARLDSNDPNDKGLRHPREPLDKIAELCLPHLQGLYVQLDAVVARGVHEQQHPENGSQPRSQTRKASVAQRLIVKIFWSCTSFLLPPCLGEPGILDSWLDPMLVTLHRPCPQFDVDDPHDLLHEPEWKTKKWISQLLVRFLRRYSNPKQVPSDEPWSRKVAERFQSYHAARATNVMLDVLSEPAKGRQLSRRVAHLGLDMMEEVVETASLWNSIRGHIDTLLTRIVFPYLCFSEEDAATWNDDPVEYVRKQYDQTEDLTSPRMAAVNLLGRMSELRAEKTVLPFLSYLLQAVLEPYRQEPVGTLRRAELSRQKFGAFTAMTAVRAKLISREPHAASFLEALVTHVEPDLRSEYGYLRAEAGWLLGQVAGCGWPEFSAKLGVTALRGCVHLLQDPEVPVQAAAASSLQHLLSQEGASHLVSPVAPQLLDRLLQIMSSLSDSFQMLLPAIESLIEGYPDETLPLAVPLMKRLINSFLQCAQTILDDSDDEDELAFMAGKLLNLVSSVISSYSSWRKPTKSERREGLHSIGKELQPLLNSAFEPSHQVFAEELFDVLETLVVSIGDLQEGLTPFLLSLIPKAANAFDEWACDHIRGLRKPLEGYLSYDMAGVVKQENGIESIKRIILRVWSEKCDESDAVEGTKLADVMILNLCKLPQESQRAAHSSVLQIAQAAATKCASLASDDDRLRLRLFACVMNALYFNSDIICRSLGPASLVQLISKLTANPDAFDRIYAKKATVLGISALLKHADLGMEEAKPSLLSVALDFQERIDAQRSSKSQTAQVGIEALAAAQNSISHFVDEPDLDDDEDASGAFDEANGTDGVTLQALANSTGVAPEALAQLGFTSGLLAQAAFVDLDDSDNDDEGNFEHVLDEINEAAFFVTCAKTASCRPWWSRVGAREQNAMQELARKVLL